MPRISFFFGIVIRMYWNERDHPVPHFHAEYGEHSAQSTSTARSLEARFRLARCASFESGPHCTGTSCSQTGRGARNREPLEEIAPLS
jgi:hypothetical protein